MGTEAGLLLFLINLLLISHLFFNLPIHRYSQQLSNTHLCVPLHKILLLSQSKSPFFLFLSIAIFPTDPISFEFLQKDADFIDLVSI